jgi:hypothetical protein
MLAHAFLVVLAASYRTQHPPPTRLISFHDYTTLRSPVSTVLTVKRRSASLSLS